MTSGVLFCLTFVSFLLATLTATGARVMNQFPRHELEEFCQRRKRMDVFDDIMDQWEANSLATEGLQMLFGAFLALTTSFLIFSFGGEWMATQLPQSKLIVAGLSSTLLLLISSSWVPWGVTRLWPSPFLFHTWRVWRFARWLGWPMSIGIKLVGILFHRLAGKHEEEEDEEETLDDEIRTIVTAGERDGLLEADARDMIEGVIELDDMTIDKIMTPRSKIDALDISNSWEQVLRFVIEVGRTRIPVYDKKIENTLGVLFVKDLLPELAKPHGEERKNIRDLLRPPWFVPQSKVVNEMLQDFLGIRNHMAIVLDEYESVAGVVTIEDVLEEIVGEIVDETDKEIDEEIRMVNEWTAFIDGSTHVDTLNEKLGLRMPVDGDYDTVAGLVINQAREIPKVGDVVQIKNARFIVTHATRRQLERLKIEVVDQLRASSEEH